MAWVQRTDYMNWLKRWKDKEVIKVVSGVRRCGKSTLLTMFRNHLITEGISPERCLTINFEDVAHEYLTDYHTLYAYISEQLVSQEMTYIFLDEIQHVDHFEKALDSLYIQPQCDIYITGSNAHLLSSELSTLLTGRYVELKMLPLSFSEFCLGAHTLFDNAPADAPITWNAALKDAAFTAYITTGSFPYILALANDNKNIMEYLHDLFQSILFKDVLTRMKMGDAALLERIGQVLASEIGSLVSINKITNTLRSSGRSIDQKTVDKYIDRYLGSMLFYEAQRWDIKGRKLLSRISKYYIVDSGLRQNLVHSSSSDIGHLLENVVFLELKRRNGNVYIGSIDDREVDFVVEHNGELSYYQVAASVTDANTFERELESLRRIKDNFPKTLLTLDRILPATNIDGIRIINAVDWLLEAERLRHFSSRA